MADTPTPAAAGPPPGRAPTKRTLAQRWAAVRAAIRAGLLAARRMAAALIRRVYALALLLVIVYLCWNAFAYLVTSLAVASRPPGQIAALPRRLDDVLDRQRPDWLGLAAVENPRSPLSHYHRFDTWIQHDSFNDCTRGGCHAPLPHSKHKEVRAFLNMHATSIHCGVCHIQAEAPLSLTWYDLREGRPRAAPAILRAATWLEQFAGAGARANLTEAHQAEIVALLREASREAQDDPSIARAADHLRAVAVTSEAFGELLDMAQDAVRRAFRGEYGAKLALLDAATGRPVFGHAGADAAVETWQREGNGASGARRDELLAAVHPQRRGEALQCTNCHTRDAGLVPFSKLGYSAERIAALRNTAIFGMIEHIRAGQPFYLPRVLRPGETEKGE